MDTTELNNRKLASEYSPEKIQVETLQSQLDKGKIQTSYSSQISSAKKKKEYTTVGSSSGKSKYTFSSGSPNVVKKVEEEKDCIEEVQSKFKDIRKQAYKDAEEELKVERENVSRINPQLESFRKKNVFRKVIENKHFQKGAVLVGIIAIQGFSIIISEELRETMIDRKEERKERRERRKKA